MIKGCKSASLVVIKPRMRLMTQALHQAGNPFSARPWTTATCPHGRSADSSRLRPEEAVNLCPRALGSTPRPSAAFFRALRAAPRPQPQAAGIQCRGAPPM